MIGDGLLRCQAKHGRDLEDFEDELEPVYDAQGIAWVVSVGRGISSTCRLNEQGGCSTEFF